LRHHSIRVKLLAAVALIALPPVFLGLFADLRALAQLQANIQAADVSLATTTGGVVDSAIDDAISVGWAVENGVATLPQSPNVLDPKLQALAALDPQFVNIVVVDRDGNSVGEMIPYGPGEQRVNLMDRPAIQRALTQNEAGVSPINIGRRSGVREVGVAVPIRGNDGKPVGAVGLTLNLAYLRARLAAASPSPDRTLIVADPVGQVAVVNGAISQSQLPASIGNVPIVEGAMRSGSGFQSTGPFAGLPGSWYGVVQRSPRYGWTVAVIEPAGQATAPITNAIAVDVAAFVVVLILAVAGSVFVSRQILEPLAALSRAAGEWSRGNLDERVAIQTGDEFETLGETFNAMASSLAQTLRELRETERQLETERNRLRAVLDTSPAGIVVVDRRGRLSMINPAARTLLGAGPEWDGASVSDLVASHLFRPDGKRYPISELPIVRSFREGVSIGSVEVLVRRPNGWQAHLLVNSAPILSSKGDALGAVAVFVDISPLAEEERLRAEFVTSAAHEFRNPLTVIRGYAEIAMRDPLVQNTSVQYELARILDAASRVERLAEALMGAAQLHLPALVLRTELIDLARLVETTVSDFLAADSGVGRQILVRARPAWVNGDPSLLCEALVDLLIQAVAVTPAEHAIEVLVSAWDGIATMAVTDFGPPLSAEEVESLFVPFVIPTGTVSSGLAGRPVLKLYLARRIAEESGGWMRARCGPNGTTVSLTLPRAEPARSGEHSATDAATRDVSRIEPG
jgi:two-component system phosphate regulon sensor histidine kinase PhoR